jgi:hypothetical protein
LHFTNKYINEKEAIRLQKKDKSLYFFK